MEEETGLRSVPYAAELNPIENVSAYIKVSKLAISAFESYIQIVDRCRVCFCGCALCDVLSIIISIYLSELPIAPAALMAAVQAKNDKTSATLRAIDEVKFISDIRKS